MLELTLPHVVVKHENASNMFGQYSRVKAHILSLNKLAFYTPCFAHSLNLVGNNAVDCCTTVVGFFDIVQKIYTLFSASTRSWIYCYEHYRVVMTRYLFLNVSLIHAGLAMLLQLKRLVKGTRKFAMLSMK